MITEYLGNSGGFADLPDLLASGGDARLLLDPISRLNDYGCRPFPRPEAFTFASSTATSISERGYAAADRRRSGLLRSVKAHGIEAAFEFHTQELRGRILTLLELERSGTEIVFSPSGTDSELDALSIARILLGTPMTSVIVASDETGSGIAQASQGNHFGMLTAHGNSVARGDPITGLGEDITSVGVPLHNKTGRMPLCAIDAAVVAEVASSIDQGRRVLLHVMDHSKLGARCPSFECLDEIERRWAGDVQILLDAAQMRLSRRRLAWHLSHGHMVLVTGSKFFTGPPFCGALLVPPNLSSRIASMSDGLPPGLTDYTSRCDWPASWHAVRASVTERANVGQLLRWFAAVQEMEDYFRVPGTWRQYALAQFAQVVPRIILNNDAIELLPDYERQIPSGCDDEELEVRTIFPFGLRPHGRELTPIECGVVYRALNGDVIGQLPLAVAAQHREIASRPCHIGQPVALGGKAMLRISAGARVVSETWSPNESVCCAKLSDEFEQVRIIVAKVNLLLSHLDALEQNFLVKEGRQTAA
jgi:hypothetical protein